jgi:thiamine kinase-like enzyme
MTIQDVIDRMGWETAGRPTVALLGGGITNLNYRVDAGGQAYVVRIPGQDSALLGIDRAREHACAIAAHESGAAPEVIAYIAEEGILITRFVDGRGLAEAEMREAGMVRRVAHALRRYHGGRPFPGTFSPFCTVRGYLAAAVARGAPLPERSGWMLKQAERLEAALGQPGASRPCHNDLLLGNFIDDGKHLCILDWEYAAMGDVFFDLGNFAAHHELPEPLERALLAAYFGAVGSGAMARLQLMRIVSDMREAMWAMVQVAISALDYDFRAYGRKHFDRCLAALCDPRLPAWLAEAAEGSGEA